MIDFEGAFILHNRLKSAKQTKVQISGISSGRSKVLSRRADGRPGTISPYLDSGRLIGILTTKGRNIRSTSNGERNTLPDGGSYMAKCLARKSKS